jgi:hypothetical protein
LGIVEYEPQQLGLLRQMVRVGGSLLFKHLEVAALGKWCGGTFFPAGNNSSQSAGS